jgi:uncharacterized protein (DUF302 family)
MTSNPDSGIVTIPSIHPVDHVVQNLEAILQSKGVKVFAIVDHCAEAQAAGLTMPPTKLVLFGSPKAGTPLMLAAPTAALDLPLKILVWQDAQGQTWVTYNSPAYLLQRHGFSPELVHNIAIIEGLAAAVAQS